MIAILAEQRGEDEKWFWKKIRGNTQWLGNTKQQEEPDPI